MTHLPAVTDLGHGIRCIDVELLRPGLACCYLIESRGRHAFIETGTALGVPRLLALLQALGIDRARVDYVMPTHVHLDHAGGAGALVEALPNARLVVHPRGERHLVDPAKLIAGATEVYGAHGFARMYGRVVPVPQARVIVAADGFTLDFNGRPLEFLDTPGHARHHYSIWDAQSRGIFAGDTFGISYRDFDGPAGPWMLPTTTPVQFEPEAWLQTLERYAGYAPQRMYLTHYAAVEDVPARLADLRAALQRYVAIARAAGAQADGEGAAGRHARLRDALERQALSELAARGCALPLARQRELLENDMELNAQGLGVWLDRERAAA